MPSYPFLPTAHTAPSSVGLAWNFSELALQDAVELAAVLGANSSLQGNAATSSLVGQLMNDAVQMALQSTFTTPGYVGSDTLNDFDNTLLEFSNFAGALGVSTFFEPLYYQSSTQYSPASALSGLAPSITSPTPSTTTG